jgi:cell division protein FtsQ
MFSSANLKKWIWFAAIIGSLGFLVFFAENIYQNQRCQKVNIVIEGDNENHLVTSTEIKSLISENGTNTPEGKLFKKIDFGKLEQKVLMNRLVKSCQIHRDLSGDLTVNLEEHTPVARFVSASKRDSYLTEKGSFIGVSPHYTVRVLLISGPYFEEKTNLRDKRSEGLMNLIEYINDDEFWTAQISQIIVEKDGGITMIPTVGNHKIEFGIPLGYETKLKKLKIFYKQILPAKGWDTYHRVSIKYRNQIVCE